MAWMTDPADWALVALIGAGVLLIAAVIATRAKAERFVLKGGVRSAVFPGMVALLAVAGAAQSLLIAPAIRHFTTAGHTAAVRHAAGHLAASDAADESEVPASGGLILTESEYLMAMQGIDPLHVGFTPHGLKLGETSAFGIVDDAFASSFVAAPLRLLTAAALAQRQREQAAAAEAIGDLVKGALNATGRGNLAGNAGDLSGTTSGSGQASPASLAMNGGTVPAIPGAPHLTAQPEATDVPEPSTWATMMIGFAACGLTMRRAGRRSRLHTVQG